MIYVIDTSSINVLKNYYTGVFSSFWESFDNLVKEGRVISVKEALNEAYSKIDSEHLQQWIRANKSIFLPPSSKTEAQYVKEIFDIPHFKYLIPDKKTINE